MKQRELVFDRAKTNTSQKESQGSIYNLLMIETLSQTPTPEKGKSECYVLVLASRAASRGSVFAFMEEHGQWNDDLQRLLYKVHSINTDEQLTYQHARGLYETSKHRLAKMGFVHSFSSEGMRKEPCSDQVSQPEAVTA